MERIHRFSVPSAVFLRVLGWGYIFVGFTAVIETSTPFGNVTLWYVLLPED